MHIWPTKSSKPQICEPPYQETKSNLAVAKCRAHVSPAKIGAQLCYHRKSTWGPVSHDKTMELQPWEEYQKFQQDNRIRALAANPWEGSLCSMHVEHCKASYPIDSFFAYHAPQHQLAKSPLQTTRQSLAVSRKTWSGNAVNIFLNLRWLKMAYCQHLTTGIG